MKNSDNQSIFGDTYQGVPNKNRAYVFRYPNRFHGPQFQYPVFDHTYRVNPYESPLRQSVIHPLHPKFGIRKHGVGDTSNQTTSFTDDLNNFYQNHKEPIFIGGAIIGGLIVLSLIF